VTTGQSEAEQKRQGLEGLSRGWAVGTHGWRQAIAKDYAHLSMAGGLERESAKALNEASWHTRLRELLTDSGRTSAELATRPRKVAWKLDLARQLRDEVGASVVWLACTLDLGRPASVRSYLARARGRQSQRTAA
jgi:putative transposase